MIDKNKCCSPHPGLRSTTPTDATWTLEFGKELKQQTWGFWLVVYLPLWKICSSNGMIIPYMKWKVIKLHGSKPPISMQLMRFLLGSLSNLAWFITSLAIHKWKIRVWLCRKNAGHWGFPRHDWKQAQFQHAQPSSSWFSPWRQP